MERVSCIKCLTGRPVSTSLVFVFISNYSAIVTVSIVVNFNCSNMYPGKRKWDSSSDEDDDIPSRKKQKVSNQHKQSIANNIDYTRISLSKNGCFIGVESRYKYRFYYKYTLN